MDQSTVTVSGMMLLVLILLSVAIRATTRGPTIFSMVGMYEPDQVQPRSMRELLVRIKKDELPVLQVLSIVGVPVLMIVFSVAVPWLRNPALLLVGALVGSLLPGFWLNGSTYDRGRHGRHGRRTGHQFSLVFRGEPAADDLAAPVAARLAGTTERSRGAALRHSP